MLKTSFVKIVRIILAFTLVVSLTSCKRDTYQVREYLFVLAETSGISDSKDIDDCFDALLNWQVVTKEEYELLDEELTDDYLKTTLERLLDNQGDISAIEIPKKLNQENVSSAIKQTVNIINNQDFKSYYSFDYNDNIETYKSKEDINYKKDKIVYVEDEDAYYKVKNGQITSIEFEDIYKDFKIQDSFEIDLNKAEIEMKGEEIKSSYVNNGYELLASNSKAFSIDGFRVSYSLNSGGISFHISKSIKNGLNIYSDVTISNIKPTYSYEYDEENVKNAYFKIDYESTSKFGISRAKYENRYLNLKNIDSSSFKSLVESLLKEKQDMPEATIPICTIATPIPNVPSVSFNIDVLLKIYAGGKAEIVLSDKSSLGFQTKNGALRLIKDIERDDDFILRASFKNALGLNFNIAMLKKRIMDIELDGGIKAEVKSTLHLYDTDDETIEESELSYDELEELVEGNDNVAVCGDISLRWLLDLKCNTSRTLLYKYGLTYTKEFMDDDDQIFGNMHHIENGEFVEKCTRTKRKNYNIKNVSYSYNKITLDTYSKVLKKNEKYEIETKLPNGYTSEELVYETTTNDIINISGNTITALKSGSAKVHIYTQDGLYETWLNILVSYE